MAGNLQFKIMLNRHYAKLSKIISGSITKDTHYKILDRWHRLFTEFKKRYSIDLYKEAKSKRNDLLGQAAITYNVNETGKSALQLLVPLAKELFGKEGI